MTHFPHLAVKLQLIFLFMNLLKLKRKKSTVHPELINRMDKNQVLIRSLEPAHAVKGQKKRKALSGNTLFVDVLASSGVLVFCVFISVLENSFKMNLRIMDKSGISDISSICTNVWVLWPQ